MQDISNFDKDQLAEYAKVTFNIDLDMRKGLDKLKDEVKALQVKPVKADTPKKPELATHILNRETGFIFPWTEQLAKHLTNAVPCDENGKPV